MERWKKIEGFSNYSISDQGRVRNDNRGSIKTNRVDKHGYHDISLYSEGQEHHKKVHRLVAEAFVEKDEERPFVNHIDGNKTNNDYKNLEWVNYSENMKHAYSTGLTKPHPTYGMLGKKNPNGGAKGKPIRIIETGEYFRSTAECARQTGLKERGINDTLKGRQQSHRGYHFEYD